MSRPAPFQLELYMKELQSNIQRYCKNVSVLISGVRLWRNQVPLFNKLPSPRYVFEMTAGDFSPENESKAWWVGDGKLVLIWILKYCSVSMWWSINDLEQRKTFNEYFFCNSKRDASQKAHEGEACTHLVILFQFFSHLHNYWLVSF